MIYPDTSHLDPYPALGFTPGTLKREEELILLLSRTILSEKEKARAGTLVGSGKVDWEEFKKLSFFHDVTPLVWRHLQVFEEGIPEGLRSFLRSESAQDLARNLDILRAVDLLSRLFRENCLEVIFTKGVPFVMDLYRDPGIRAFSDIDALVRPRDLEKAHKLLTSNGFILREGDPSPESYRSQNSYFLEGRIHLDLHRCFLGRTLHDRMLGIDYESIWRDKREVELADTRIFTLGLEDDLIYQCLHLSLHHSFAGIKWNVDISEFLKRRGEGMDWDKFLGKVRGYRVRRPVYYALLFTRNVLDAPVPDKVLKGLGVKERALDRWSFRKIKSNRGGVDYLAELVMFDSLRDSARFVGLSLARHPRKLGHFAKIGGKILKSAWRKAKG